MSPPLRRISWLLVATVPLMGGCQNAKLPDCVVDTDTPSTTKPASPRKDASELVVGIDGSGSMLGLARAADASNWAKLLQSVNLAAKTEGLQVSAFRVGGGAAQVFGGGSVTPATDPCFFQGCGGFTSVASSLQTLWEQPTTKGQTPLRLIVSDLEVNQNDITTLVGGIGKDLALGASVGVLGLKLPFQGQIFNGVGSVIYTGQANRPVYLLATGKKDQVRSLLETIRKNLGLKGVAGEQYLSLLGSGNDSKPLLAKSIFGVPPAAAATGLPLRLNNASYSPSNNPDYQFIRLSPKAEGFVMSTIQDMNGGTTRPDLGVLVIEGIPLPPDKSTSLSGVRLKATTIAGAHLQTELRIDTATPSGLLRATIPRGGLPEQWWLDWDRTDPKDPKAREQTDGLLLLLTTLGQQLQHDSTAPAVALCVAFQRS